MPIDAIIAIESPWLSATAALGIAVLAALGIRSVRGSTLTAPAVWGAVSALVIATVEVFQATQRGGEADLTDSLWRYAAAVSTFCPIMAVLGSKRPQNRGWQWVVVSLWIVLLVPAGQALAAASGARLELSVVWRGMITALLIMELLNYAPTRFALAAIIAAGGQALMLLPYLLNEAGGERSRNAGLLTIFVAGVVAHVLASRRGNEEAECSSDRRLDCLERRWFAFRDGWGAFWGLRILQRINHTAELSRWPVRLQWSQGFVGEKVADADEALVAHIEQTFDSLLRRFERLNQTAQQTRPS